MIRGMLLPEAAIDSVIVQCRGEIAAVNAYDRAIEKFAGQSEASMLLVIRNEHDDAVARLRAIVESAGGKIPHDGGAWGGLASVVNSVAVLVNDEVPLQVLQKGEEFGIRGYEAMLADACLSESHTTLTFLRDRCTSHHAGLQRLREHILEAPTRPMTAW